MLRLPAQGPWQVTVLPHPDPLYRVEGEADRRADGIYDAMQPVGADEIVIETPEHNRKLEDLSEDQILLVMEAWRQRIEDLKRDRRFKYVSVYKNYGPLAGQEGSHAHSQVTATTFVPRRILYELRAAREWYAEKERCVFCDIVKQEERQGKRIVDTQGDYVALCPYASRVPFEVWMIDRKHNHLFERPRPGSNRRQLAALLRRILRRIRQVAPAYHMVVHSAPNMHPSQRRNLLRTGRPLPTTITGTSKSCPSSRRAASPTASRKFITTPLMPEEAAARLRNLDPIS